MKNNLVFHTCMALYQIGKNQYGAKNTEKLLKIYQQEPCLDIRVKIEINYWVKRIKRIKIGNNTVRVSNKGKIENFKGYKEGAVVDSGHCSSATSYFDGQY